MRGTAVPPPEPDPRERALAKTLGLPDLLVRVLLARGVATPDQAKAFLRPDLGALHDPFTFRDMHKAVARIQQALRAGEGILIHGDYDVDGISGTVLLHKFFGLLHASSKPYIPARADGYSFSRASVDAVLKSGCKLVISVDNGTNASAPIAELQAHGIDVIVTDHHGTEHDVARPFAMLNPRLPDAGYPDRNLAGCGVAFRLAAALATALTGSRLLSPEFREFLLDAMGYVALGTVADVAPLCGENRIFVHHGLRALAQSRNPGIRALLDSGSVQHRGVDVEDIAFRLAPLLNAAGRVGHALDAVTLLCAPGYSEAQVAAKVLERHNEERRRVERQLQDEVLQLARAEAGPTIVLGSEHWHPGVLGIVAARIAETMHKPVLLIAFHGEVGRGSGRCTTGVNLRQALADCSELLVAHGGHAAAAGLEVRREHFPTFQERFATACQRQQIANGDVAVDGIANFGELDPHTIRRLDMLGPFGSGYPRPRFHATGVRAVGQPFTDLRGQDVRVRLVRDGQVLPARVLRGNARFEELRLHRGTWTIVFSPRLCHRGEDGPVQLDIHQLIADGTAGSSDRYDATTHIPCHDPAIAPRRGPPPLRLGPPLGNDALRDPGSVLAELRREQLLPDPARRAADRDVHRQRREELSLRPLVLDRFRARRHRRLRHRRVLLEHRCRVRLLLSLRVQPGDLRARRRSLQAVRLLDRVHRRVHADSLQGDHDHRRRVRHELPDVRVRVRRRPQRPLLPGRLAVQTLRPADQGVHRTPLRAGDDRRHPAAGRRLRRDQAARRPLALSHPPARRPASES
jgi:single-stranded-DNA-specific exonuclease